MFHVILLDKKYHGCLIVQFLQINQDERIGEILAVKANTIYVKLQSSCLTYVN